MNTIGKHGCGAAIFEGMNYCLDCGVEITEEYRKSLLAKPEPECGFGCACWMCEPASEDRGIWMGDKP